RLGRWGPGRHHRRRRPPDRGRDRPAGGRPARPVGAAPRDPGPAAGGAGGDPLYAEEFVRLLSDRGLLVRSGRVVRLATTAAIPFPDTVQAPTATPLHMPAARRHALRPRP